MKLENFLESLKPIAEPLELRVFFGTMANWNRTRTPAKWVLLVEPPTSLPLELDQECFDNLSIVFRIGVQRDIGDKVLDPQLGEDVYYHQMLREKTSDFVDKLSKSPKFLLRTPKSEIFTQYWEADTAPTPNSYSFIRFTLPLNYYTWTD
jgi:hypothetical protein